MALVSLQLATYVIISIAFAFGTASIFLRLYCRWRLQIFGPDDAVAIFLFVCDMYQSSKTYTDGLLVCQYDAAGNPLQFSLIRMWTVSLYRRCLDNYGTTTDSTRPAGQAPPGMMEHITKVRKPLNLRNWK